MTRILIADMKQETATFNPAPTTYDCFRIYHGMQLLEAFQESDTEIAGALDVFAGRDEVEVVPAMAADSVSGGPIPTADLDRLINELVDSVQSAGAVDAAYFCMHGAMAGETEPDPEGAALVRLRDVLGDIPIVVSLDLHAILTERMLEAADIVVPYHTYPHVDQYSTGQRAARNLLAIIDGARPTMVRVPIPMIVRGDELITATGTFGKAIALCQQVEESEGGLSAGVIIGNAFTDVPDLRSNALVCLDGDAERALREAKRIARFMWEHREMYQADLVSLEKGIEIACTTEGLTVFSDAADATASGASGDSNKILEGLLAAEFPGSVLLPIVDAPAVAVAVAAGVGATVEVTLGGTLDSGRFDPLPVTARVSSLHDGHFVYENGMAARAGPVAVLEVGRMDILVTSRSIYVVGQDVFTSHGLDPRDYDVVVVKSPNGFRTYYEQIASSIVPVDVPGSTSANLQSLPFANCPRPIFPLDDDAQPCFLDSP
ncbi:MAG: M81 family metallopeptidase [Pirellulaceae bacterium]